MVCLIGAADAEIADKENIATAVNLINFANFILPPKIKKVITMR